jgi:hypothetical protein
MSVTMDMDSIAEYLREREKIVFIIKIFAIGVL